MPLAPTFRARVSIWTTPDLFARPPVLRTSGAGSAEISSLVGTSASGPETSTPGAGETLPEASSRKRVSGLSVCLTKMGPLSFLKP